MRSFFLSILLLVRFSTVAQKEPNSFLNKLCQRYSNNIGESKGINLKLFIPCEWISMAIDIPHGIFKYNYKEFSSVLASETLVVANLGKTTDEDAKYLITEPGLRLMTKGATGTYVSFKSLIVNDVKGGEVIIKNELNKSDGIYLNFITQDYFIYGRKIILIQYAITSKSELLCQKYLLLFNTLLNRSKIQE